MRIGIRIFPHIISVFVHIKYTSNMAARYYSDVNDVTAPHENKSLTYLLCLRGNAKIASRPGNNELVLGLDLMFK